MASRVTAKDIRRFLSVLAADGRIVKAVEESRHQRSTWYKKKANDVEFAASWEKARMDYLNNVEDQMLDWAMNGVPTEVIEVAVDSDGKEVGKRVTKKGTKKDPKLLLRILERRHPDYKPGVDVVMPGVTGVLVTPGTAPTESAWAEQFAVDGD